jgi:hypothetical protein
VEKTVIDRAVRAVYREYLSDGEPDPDEMHLLLKEEQTAA